MLQFCKEHLFGVPSTMKGAKQMPTIKEELLTIILENDNPEQAVLTASTIIFDFLKQYESHQEETSVYPQGFSQRNPSF